MRQASSGGGVWDNETDLMGRGAWVEGGGQGNGRGVGGGGWELLDRPLGEGGMRMHEWLASGWGYVMVGDNCEPFRP